LLAIANVIILLIIIVHLTIIVVISLVIISTFTAGFVLQLLPALVELIEVKPTKQVL